MISRGRTCGGRGICGGHEIIFGGRGVSSGLGVRGRGSCVSLSRQLLLFSVQVDLDGGHSAGGESERAGSALEALCAGELKDGEELAPRGLVGVDFRFVIDSYLGLPASLQFR